MSELPAKHSVEKQIKNLKEWIEVLESANAVQFFNSNHPSNTRFSFINPSSNINSEELAEAKVHFLFLKEKIREYIMLELGQIWGKHDPKGLKQYMDDQLLKKVNQLFQKYTSEEVN